MYSRFALVFGLAFILILGRTTQSQDLPAAGLQQQLESLRAERDSMLKDKQEVLIRLDAAKRDAAELLEAHTQIERLRHQLAEANQRADRAEKLLAERDPQASKLASQGLVLGGLVTAPWSQSHAVHKTAGSIKGVVTETNPTGMLMVLSVGKEDGVALTQELDCFRLGSVDPRAKNPPLYIGKVRVTKVMAHQSIAEFVPIRGFERRPRVGDEIASDLLAK